jgi:hypothetical protein
MNLEKGIAQTYMQHVMTTRIEGDRGILAVLSDIHEGANNRKYLQESVKFLLSLRDRCKVVIGGDSTNSITKNSKGSTIEEWASGSDQILSLVEDIKPLYESGQILGIISGNHTQRSYNETFITVEMMLASILGDRNLYKGSMGIVYFNSGKNMYVHHIIHKHSAVEGRYDYFSADVNWFEHKHKPMARPKIIVEHNKYAKCPVVKQCWDLFQSSFQDYPDYAKKMGLKPSLPSFWMCEMGSDTHNRYVYPYLDSTYKNMIANGYKF